MGGYYVSLSSQKRHKTMATVRLIPDTRAKKDGSQMILLVIRIGKTRFVFSTGISTPSSEKFNEMSYLDKSVPQSKVKNVRLVSLKNKAEKLIIDDEARLSSLPSAKAKEIISEYVFDEKVVKKTRCFIDYLDEFVSISLIMNTTMLSLKKMEKKDTWKHYRK